MPVQPTTVRAVRAVLDLDASATPAVKAAVARVLEEELSSSIEEGEAAKIIDISRASLYKWRNGTWDNAPHDFIFHTWATASGETRYDRDEMAAYESLRKIICTRETPQPVITREQLLRYVRLRRDALI